MTTGGSLKTLGFILLLGIAPVAGCHAVEVQINTETRLKPCPRSPNCVCSVNRDDRHAIQPLVYSGSLEDARQALLAVLKTVPRTTVISSEPDFIHAAFKSRIFGFVDDVEFFFPAGQRLIHVRSASRTGYYDFGVNRKRVERMRGDLKEALRVTGDGK
jgi:uncharacterized protein (DUF1499 family)